MSVLDSTLPALFHVTLSSFSPSPPYPLSPFFSISPVPLCSLTQMSTALEMRTRQKEIDRVDIELERRSQEIRELQSRLQDAEKILELAVYHGKQKLESIKQANAGAVSPEELIRYAHRISQARSAVSPVGWQPSELSAL